MEREEIERKILLLDLDKKRHERKERLKPVFFSRSMIITCGSVIIAIFSVIAGLQTGAYKKALTEKEISMVNLDKQYAENELKKVIEEVVLKRNEKDQLSSVVEQLEANKESLEREVSSLNDQKTSHREEIIGQKGVQTELQQTIAEKMAVINGLIADEKELNKSVKKLNETIEGLKRDLATRIHESEILNRDINSKKGEIGELKVQEKALVDEISKLIKAREAANNQTQPTQ